ncbi:hypothetical protein APT_01635 [Acetobacter pasteurianus NBRC 101655]|nr:hypothetical protein APT_01635 [Acetobacter pasteurianus NBRC 101655]
MPVKRIEKIEGGVVTKRAEVNAKGFYVCLPFGCNLLRDAKLFRNLDDVAKYLRANPKAGVRMNPGWGKISEDIFIDGLPR